MATSTQASGGRPATELRRGHPRASRPGLDALDSSATLPPGPGPGKRFVRSVLPPIVFLAALVGVWQLAYVAEVKPLVRAALAGRRRGGLLDDGDRRPGLRGDLDQPQPRRASASGSPWSSAPPSAWPCGGAGGCARRSARSSAGCRACPRWPGCPAAIIWFQPDGRGDLHRRPAGRGALDRQRPAQRDEAGAAAVRPRRPRARAVHPRPDPVRAAAGRAAGVPRRSAAGLGVRLALPDGRRADHLLAAARTGPGSAAQRSAASSPRCRW